MDSKNMTVQLKKNKQKHPFVIKYSFITNKDNNGKKPVLFKIDIYNYTYLKLFFNDFCCILA